MRSLNKENFKEYAFKVAMSLTAFAATLFVGMKLSGTHQSIITILFLAIVGFAIALFFLAAGAWWRMRKHRSPRAVRKMAEDLLERLASSAVGNRLLDPSNMEISIPELIESLNGYEREECKEILETLYEGVPGRHLPRTFRNNPRPALDWHAYDLCIAVADEDLPVAEEICEKLRNYQLRIHLPTLIVIHERVKQRVFFGGSKKCLALVSAHLLIDARSHSELAIAQQRADRITDQYLVAIGLDHRGRDHIRTDEWLAKYAKYMGRDLDRHQMVEAIAQLLLQLLNISVRPKPQDLLPAHFAVALSYPSKNDKALAVVKELDRLLPGEQIFDFHKYEHLAAADLDLNLQNVYHDQSELVVVFGCSEYLESTWCTREWRAIRDLLTTGGSRVPMILKLDQTHLPGVFEYDGYVECERRSARKIAEMICERLLAIRRKR